ncbi:MAG: DNA polymerase III subunit gamma/tau [Aphanocapsa sp. GSE-SYN-MK-11-07L]|nr:DNA polymerase III subunit gamma/tau [Aphanocapsa sp. GSE-SYN-MK-11-07L]
MTYEPLHHKYRPQTFADLVGQMAIATTLTNALDQERIAPAYLFTGPRGTGKTSSARILAKSLNCLQSQKPTPQPCGVCEVCRAIANGSALDVIEIDAASNTGVDNIRELIEKAQFAPVQCRYKVYVVDECHMLSTSAFNALLKTLEEPPDRVIFVLATTDPQRVLPTIISRCQRFDFRRIPLPDMVQHLGAIARQEAIEISPDALNLVGQIAQGGLRDAESLLDQLSLLSGQITIERVWDLAGAVPEQDLLKLVQAIASNSPEAVLDQARHLMERGREPLIVLQNLASFYRDLLIAKTAPHRPDLAALTPATWQQLCAFVEAIEISTILAGQQHLRTCELQVKNTTQPRLWLEVALMGLLPSSLATGSNVVAKPAPLPSLPKPVAPPLPPPAPTLPTKEEVLAEVTPAPVAELQSPPDLAIKNGTVAPAESAIPPEVISSPPVIVEPLEEVASGPPTELEPTTEVDLATLWQNVLGRIQPFSTQSLLRQQAHLLGLKGREAKVGIKAAPLLKMAQERLPNIEAAFLEVLNHPIRVRLEVAASSAPIPPAQPPINPTEPPKLRSQSGSAHPSPVLQETPSLDPASNSVAAPTAPTPYWQEADEVTKAARSLAQFFNGVVVDPEAREVGINSVVPQAELIADPAVPELEEKEPEEDLPF